MRSPKCLLALLSLVGVTAPSCARRLPPPARVVDAGAVEQTADPCVDFYQFTCERWMADHPIPPDRSRYGTFDELAERNEAVLRDILEKAAADDSGRDAVDRKIGDFYASCMDEAAIDAKGAEPLAPELGRIAALEGAHALPPLLARLHSIGVNAFFRVGSEQDPHHPPTVVAAVDQGGLGLPDRDDYTRTDARAVEIRARYRAHVEAMLGLLGEPPKQAAANAAAAIRIEAALAGASLSRVDRRDPARTDHPMTVAELQAGSRAFDWPRYFAEVGAPPFERLNVGVPAFMKEVSRILACEPLPAIQAYLRWRLLDAMAAHLSSDFVAQDFAFHGKTLRGASELRPRWKRCVASTDGELGEALGQPYVARTFGAEGKQRTLAMVQRLERALHEDVAGLDWMTETTRQRALAKLAGITNKIGYPDRWRDYSALEVRRGDYLGDVQRGEAFELQRQLDRIGKPADKREWDMTPPTVNAYYDPEQNSINFPAGILQPPFYDNRADEAVNLGGIGAVIGHELTHGFDDQGRQYDVHGELRDWWTAADARAFADRASCFVGQYGALVAVGDVDVDGRLTLGENLADNGGLRLALMALRETPVQEAPAAGGPTEEQRLFTSWGQIWCQNVTPETARLLALTDPHAPNRYRVNAVVSNMPEFAEAFACKPGQPMVRGDRCRVW